MNENFLRAQRTLHDGITAGSELLDSMEALHGKAAALQLAGVATLVRVAQAQHRIMVGMAGAVDMDDDGRELMMTHFQQSMDAVAEALAVIVAAMTEGRQDADGFERLATAIVSRPIEDSTKALGEVMKGME